MSELVQTPFLAKCVAWQGDHHRYARHEGSLAECVRCLRNLMLNGFTGAEVVRVMREWER